MPAYLSTLTNQKAIDRHRERAEVVFDRRMAILDRETRRVARVKAQRILCPRIRHLISERQCADCRAAAHMVPVLAEACGRCEHSSSFHGPTETQV